MNIIEAVRKAIQDFPEVEKLVHIDFNSDTSEEYGLYPTGDVLISKNILGVQKRRHTFIFYAVLQSVSDYDRLANSGTLLKLQQWLEYYPSFQSVPLSFEIVVNQPSSYTDIITGETTVENHRKKTIQGQLEKLTCSNGMLYSIPDRNMNSGVRYQLQITAEYTTESEEIF